MNKELAIKLSNVYKSFGNNHVVRGLNLEIFKGESVVLLGGSGTGKSVTLKLMLGLLKPDSGNIQITGKEITTLKEDELYKNNKNIGMLFQSGALFDSISVWENIAFSLINVDKIPLVKARQIAIEKLDDVGLSKEVADMMPDDLSGGMKKRVGLARAIADNPEIIFFDEPTTGLDPIMSNVINNLIKKCVKQLGATAFTITHDINSAKQIADRVVVLHEGKIIWSGTPNELDTTSCEYVKNFVSGNSSKILTFYK